MKKQTITYSQVGDNYDTKDPIKKLAQSAAGKTAINLKKHGFKSLDAGFIEKGERQVIIKPKNITFKGETLDLR